MTTKHEEVVALRPGLCHVCQSADNTALCQKCGKPVCGQHRWGFGSVSEGYFCSSPDCTAPKVFFTQNSVSPPLDEFNSIDRLLLKTPGWAIVLAAVVVGFILSHFLLKAPP